jgi:S-formylglutathione hydrolase
MVFAVYLPPQAEPAPLPVLYWLSGLTCTDENFMQKAGAQRMAAELGADHRCPRHQPARPEVPGDPDGGWDFGLGAGFYLNASEAPWAQHYRMHDYVVHELPALIEPTSRPRPARHQRPLDGRARRAGLRPAQSGALSVGLGLRADLQSDALPLGREGLFPLPRAKIVRNGGNGMPACCWRRCTRNLPILIDQGDRDDFLASQLKPEALQAAAKAANHPLTLRRAAGLRPQLLLHRQLHRRVDHLRHGF